jgi:hypothetical protein
MTDTPNLGPIALCTLIATDGKALIDAYTGWLHLDVADTGPLDADTAAAIDLPQLAGNPSWLLSNTKGRRWLQVIEHKTAIPRNTLHTYGWLALEILVADVDQLAERLTESPFEILRPAADLDVSDKIRACQVRGPAGEILYLTQVTGKVPPFDLPTCEAPVDRLFIPVLSTPSRDQSLAQYSTISGNAGISFDTKITVVNQARNYALDQRHPVATLQLAGQALIEIDQIDGTVQADAGIASGLACVAFQCNRPPDDSALRASVGPFAGHRTSAHRGCAGEHFTLVYP